MVPQALFSIIYHKTMKILIYTAANGHYVDYSQIWEYCIRYSYPDYDCKCEVLTLSSKQPTYYSACYRLITRPSNDYDYIYVTDVDMLILPEEPSLSEFHIAEMEAEKLCYSNTPRKKEVMGPRRLTGLHFASQEWYDKTQEQRDYYLHAISGGLIGHGRFDDELMLMKICTESHLPIPGRKHLISRHHGIHLGTIRAYINHSRQQMRRQLLMRINRHQAAQWVEIADQPEFKIIVRNMGNKTIRDELTILYAFCRSLLNGQ